MSETDTRAALVTGASSGIGRATAHALASDGINVALAARRESELADIAEEVEAEYGWRRPSSRPTFATSRPSSRWSGTRFPRLAASTCS